jgi:hypothetical protein
VGILSGLVHGCYLALTTGKLAVVSSRSTSDAKAAVERWQRTGAALAEVRREELRQMTDADALTAARDLLDLLRYLPARQELSGLVEQQRVFARVRG